MQLPVHREGVPIIAGFAAAAFLLWLIWAPLGWAGGVLAVWSIWFFRDPDRAPPDIPGAVLSPADGRLLPIDSAPPPPELEMGGEAWTRVRIFMNIFDVHVYRIPADGIILSTRYRPGRFVNASFDKASEDNERLAVRMRLPTGEELAFVQIAGLVARRIRSNLRPGDEVRAGERFGLIRFGSRVDVYLPPGMEPRLRERQPMRGGETVIAIAGGRNSAGDATGPDAAGGTAP